MLELLWTAFCWFWVAFSFGGLLMALALVMQARQLTKKIHQQQVLGPYRPNVRRVT